MEQNIWIQDGNTFIKGSATTKAHPEGLPKGIYEVKESMTGYYLNRLGDSFVFNYKLYGINNKFIDHFIKTYNNTTGNLGVLFNGIKGTGKTVTAEELCNRIGLPVIIVKSCKEVDDMLKFLATQINFDCIFFFDEYEKEFRESSSVLSFMDGVHNIVKYSYLPLMSQKLIIIYQVVHHVLDMYVLLAIYLKKPHLSYLMIF